MKIIIATGIYPPDAGGPANYAKQLIKEFESLGHQVGVVTYRLEKQLPIGLRHLYYFLKCLPRIYNADFVIILDTFSVGFPMFLATRIFRRPIILRTGGDFVWEQFIEHAKEKILLKNFYKPLPDNLSTKEKIIYNLTKYLLRRLDAIIFSTEFQQEIFLDGYGLKKGKTFVVENYFGAKKPSLAPQKKNFLWAGRKNILKNLEVLKRAFGLAKKENPSIELEISEQISREELLIKISNCYAVIYPSITEISPNFILEAIMLNKPFISTREVGFYNRIKDLGLFIDPLSERDIADKIIKLADDSCYSKHVNKLRAFQHIHSYKEIAQEFLDIINKVKQNKK